MDCLPFARQFGAVKSGDRPRSSTHAHWVFWLVIVLFCLTPLNPLQSSDNTNIPDQLDESEAERIHQIFSIYSILRSHRIELSSDATWQLAETILEESERYSLEPMLVVAVIKVESQFRYKAVSRVGARGLMQILPWVGHSLAGQIELEDWEGTNSLDDPETNIRVGVFYVAYLTERFKDIGVALTAYNRGPSAVSKKLTGNEVLPSSYARRVFSAYPRFRKARPQSPSFLPSQAQKKGR